MKKYYLAHRDGITGGYALSEGKDKSHLHNPQTFGRITLDELIKTLDKIIDTNRNSELEAANFPHEYRERLKKHYADTKVSLYFDH